MGTLGILSCFASAEDPDDKIVRLKGEIIETYEVEVKKEWERLLDSVPRKDRKILEEVKLDYSMSWEPLSFSARPGKRPRITIGYGGLHAIEQTMKAFALEAQGKVTTEWVVQYLAYMRSRWLRGKDWYELVADVAGVDEEQMSERYHLQLRYYRDTALRFILTHEAAHVILGHDSDDVGRETLEEQEEAADDYAMELLLSRKDPPSGFSLLLYCSAMVYDPPKEGSNSSRHLPDRARIVSLTERQLRDLDERPPKKNREGLESSMRATLRSFSPQNYKGMLKRRDEIMESGFPLLKLHRSLR